PEKRRDRVLTPNEIQAVWKALSTENDSIRHVFGILLHTGQRPNEVLSMEWRDLDLDSGWWKIPANKTKNGLSHRVPIQNFVYNILHSRKDNKSTWVFPNLQGREGHMINIYKAKRRIENHTGIFFNVYDFRRTVASMMTSFGISRLVVSKILNHVERGITSVYDRHSYDADKVAALSMWETRLGMIFSDLRAVTNTARVGQ
ncbi:MAG: site-specific integrase, partial [Lyngbya sp.]|nr:site-specific integrase [Lyngbya sp.]